MLYTIAHIIQNKAPWLWNMVERMNAVAFQMLRSSSIAQLNVCCSDGVRLANEDDAHRLQQFFAEQPEENYKWFRPHGFDETSLRRLLRLPSYIMYVQEEDGEVIGYAFLRCFCNGKCFLGKMVDYRHQGKGVCTTLCRVGMRMASMLRVRMYESINEDNVGSMKASRRACEVMVVETLEDGDVLIEDKPKEDDEWYVKNGFKACGLK